MREVEPDPAPAAPRGGRDALHVQPLARLELNPGEQDEGDLVTLSVEQRFDVVGAQRALAVTRRDPHQRVARVETMELDLRHDGVAVGRERAILDQDAPARGGRTVEGGEHQVEVHRQRVHSHHFLRGGPNQPGERRPDRLVVGIPGSRFLEIRPDPALGPAQELVLDPRGSRPRLEAQRMAA